MARERFKTVPAVYLFLYKKGNILLTRRYQTGYEDGKYMVPSGHVEAGESLCSAVVRETGEEVGLSVRPEDLRLAYIMYRAPHDETGTRSDFFFTAERYAGEPRNREPEKCDEVGWFPADNLPENTVAYLRHAIEHARKGGMFCDWGWNDTAMV
ncbi:MAG: NUDIX domain-containing protein [Patescibacteria group bacterium]